LAQLENKLLAVELFDGNFKFVFFWYVAGFQRIVDSGTLGKRSILYVTVWESAGAEWRCGSVLYVGMLRVLYSVLYCYGVWCTEH
jgi:hypothetical protein